MQDLGIQILILITTGLSLILIAWALFVKTRKQNFKSDLPKQFLTNSVLNFRNSLIIVLSVLMIITLTAIFKGGTTKELFSNENLLLIVPVVLSFIIVYFLEPLARK